MQPARAQVQGHSSVTFRSAASPMVLTGIYRVRWSLDPQLMLYMLKKDARTCHGIGSDRRISLTLRIRLLPSYRVLASTPCKTKAIDTIQICLLAASSHNSISRYSRH